MATSQWAWIILMDSPCNYCNAYNYLGHCGTTECSIPKELDELNSLMDFLCVNPQELIEMFRFYEEILDDLILQEEEYFQELTQDADYWSELWDDLRWMNLNS